MPINRPHYRSGIVIVVLSFLMAITLWLITLPGIWNHFKPRWEVLILIYWCLAMPQRVGMVTGFIVGLFVDTAEGSYLGQHALGMVVVAYLTLSFYPRVRLSPVFQQAATVFVLLLLYELLLFWFDAVARTNITTAGISSNWSDLKTRLHPISGFLVWPLLVYFFHGLTRRFHIRNEMRE